MRYMFDTARTWILFLFCVIAYAGCQSKPEKPVIHYEILPAAPLNDSLFANHPNYAADFASWKTVYENCMHDSLFGNAFYLGLQRDLGIGGISNHTGINLNKQISVLDTSSNSDIFNI